MYKNHRKQLTSVKHNTFLLEFLVAYKCDNQFIIAFLVYSK